MLVLATAALQAGAEQERCIVSVQMNDTKKLKLECSLFTPETEATCRGGGMPLVIYCHCNSGSRRDSEEALHLLMPAGIRVFALDFAVGAQMALAEPTLCLYCIGLTPT